MVFDYLPEAYRHGDNQRAREKMHNASTIAGMAFTNAFLGLNHAMAHNLGAVFHLSHGRANAVLLPYVIEYNAQLPTKFISFPKYRSFIADQRYAEIARALGLPAASTAEGVASLLNAIRRLLQTLDLPSRIAECGIEKERYLAAIPQLAQSAFEDQTVTSNPRLPLISEIAEVFQAAY